MTFYEILTLLVFLLAIVTIINEKILKLQFNIGIMIISIALSGLCIYLEIIGVLNFKHSNLIFLQRNNLSLLILHVLLSYLLFAAALHINVSKLKKEKWIIAFLSTISVVLFVFIFSLTLYYISRIINVPIPFPITLLIGAILSPTDPIAVMGILNSYGLEKNLKVLFSGESLFNDAIGFILFISIFKLSTNTFSLQHSLSDLLIEVVGGVGLGIILGYVQMIILRTLETAIPAILLSLSLISYAFIIAEKFHFSGPLAVIIMGIILSLKRNELTILKKDSHYLTFFSIIDNILNGLLFLLIGMVISIIHFEPNYLIIAGITILLSLLARYISVIPPIMLYTQQIGLNITKQNAAKLLTWGGLKGGLSIALALSLPNSETYNFIIPIIYVSVVFSIVFQGLTIGKAYKSISN